MFSFYLNESTTVKTKIKENCLIGNYCYILNTQTIYTSIMFMNILKLKNFDSNN